MIGNYPVYGSKIKHYKNQQYDNYNLSRYATLVAIGHRVYVNGTVCFLNTSMFQWIKDDSVIAITFSDACG